MARPLRRVGVAQVPAREPRPVPARMGLDYVDIFYSHRFDPETPLEETMGALDTAVARARPSTPASRPTRPSRRARRRRSCGPRHAAADPPAVVLDAQPLDRARAARRAGGGGRRLHRLLAAGAGHAHRPYLDGIPDDSRASREHVALARPAHRRDAGEGAGAERDRRAPRPVARAAGARLGPARPAGDLGARRREQRRAAGGERRRARPPRFTDDELAEIDRYATEADINLWARSSES